MTLYDVVITSLIVVGLGLSAWASFEMEKARKAGKIRYIGRVRVGVDDSNRMDWIAANHSRLQDVYWRLENEGGTVRDAIDWLAEAQKNERPAGLDKP
jgi:hypothetical protein